MICHSPFSVSAQPDLVLHRADGFIARLAGLLGRPCLLPNEGLWIEPCNGVHTLMMRYAIDVVFIDRHQRILRIEHGVKPGRVVICFKARSAIELHAGYCARHRDHPVQLDRAMRAALFSGP